MSEAALGTNAVGTALAEETAVTVIGPAHYEPAAQQLCCYAAPIRDATNRIVGVLDISGPREAADPLLGILVQSLALTLESRLSSHPLGLTPILETLPVAVWITDADGTVAMSNRAGRRLWGGELRVPMSEYDRFKAWWPDGRRLGAEDWGLARALRSGKVAIDEEVHIETFDGLHKVIRNLAAPIFDGNGRIVGGVAVNEDITQQKRVEATRDRFSGILGHDLRNPLNAITMSARLLLQRGGLEAPQARAVSRIQSSAGRIQELVDGLLDFTRARYSMGFPIEPQQADMAEIAASIVDELRAAHPERVIRLERHGNTRGSWDSARVAQAVSNLIANAVQHGRDPLVVQVNDAGDAVTVSVSNAGTRISTAKLSSLFEPFRKSDDSKGMGLGLFIAREIVRSHGGTIEVTSTDESTTFTIRWPRAVR
jgi:PAS domain S-box-containing protein